MRVSEEHRRKMTDEVFAFIAGYVSENGWAPTYKEIVDGTDLNSTSTVATYLQRLEARGYIRFGNAPRKIAMTEKGWEEVGKLET